MDLTSPFKSQLSHPEIKNDEAGRIWVLWQEMAPSPNRWQLLINRSDDYGKTWLKEAIRLTGPGQRGEKFRNPSFHADRSGHLYVVWGGGPGGVQELYLNRSQDFGATWLPREGRIGKPQKGT